MHVLQFLAVEAADSVSAVRKVEKFINESVNEPGMSTWFDWFDIGGRWDGYFDGKNVLNLSDSEAFTNVYNEIVEDRETVLNSLRGRIDFVNLPELLKEHSGEGSDFDTFEQFFLISRVIEMLTFRWCPDSVAYDIDRTTGSMQYVKERLSVNPSQQFFVAVDFHY